MADVLRAVKVDGSVVRVWRWRIRRNHSLYVQVNSGPPTWWIPQVRLRRLYPSVMSASSRRWPAGYESAPESLSRTSGTCDGRAGAVISCRDVTGTYTDLPHAPTASSTPERNYEHNNPSPRRR